MSYEDEPENPEMDEFSMNISSMIDEEVKRRAAETVQQLEQSRQYNQELLRRLNESQTKNRASEQEKAKMLREKETEVKRELFGGFTVGDTVFYPKPKHNSVTCETCKGNGQFKITLDDGEHLVNCPKCSGYKSVGFTTYSPQQDKIRSAHFEMNQHKKWLYFYLEREDIKREADKVFKTIEECQAYCDEKNEPKAAV